MLAVVGIGADGWPGLTDEARRVIAEAPLIVGSGRQLDLLPVEVGGPRLAWPSPIGPLVDELAIGLHGRAVVLASGDPMLHGIGATLVGAAGVDRVRVLPHRSAFTLACARMGWSEVDVGLVSAVACELEVVVRSLQPGRRIVVYVTGAEGAARLARVVADHGCGASAFSILEQLGGPREARVDTTAARAVGHRADPLHVVAITVAGGPAHSSTPGRPDGAYVSDGQLTKRHVRAITVSGLGPLPGDLLWDIGAGSGSVGIEWLRAEPSAAAIAIEQRADRASAITRNALALGVPELRVVGGRAPDALVDLRRPDAIFIGGGITTPGLLEACWDALKPGGRLLASTVTLEGEHRLAAGRRSHGGSLTRIEIAEAEPIGAFTGWRARMAVVQWATTKSR
ncbi:MAG: precorrin-6B C5,15-methyltransferase / cobalt-precorrin-6B C5,C15-methyltransferase [Solirubrobacteraceae bacterium]|jgi:precorrin-6Y C5,15-methyltransferase (decarboxylating)|nr:precorrin-6B C5,15-methyltransferase / cobalt-precorrin-6B C5,C15-methyltransferase [Solirubrobacteraceae bacterium]